MIFQGTLSETPPADALMAHFPRDDGQIAPYQGQCAGWHADVYGQDEIRTEHASPEPELPVPPVYADKGETLHRTVYWGIAYYYSPYGKGYRLHVPFDGHTPIF